MSKALPTSSEKISEIFKTQQAFEPVLSQSTYRERIIKLKRLREFITDEGGQQKIVDAVMADLRKPYPETLGSEISTVLAEINDLIRNLRRWLKPKKVTTPLPLKGAKSYIQYESKGCSLIIAPWNYPFNLAIGPLTYAIAAGNPVIIKPSEYAIHTSQLIADMVSELFPEKEVAVVQGSVETSTHLLSLPFRHIFFTGSPMVGKIVMKAAAEHLTSVTLELGGKSPCIVDESASLEKAAARIAWGKCYNAGQTCIAPDYLLVHESVSEKFTAILKEKLTARYNAKGAGIINSEDLGRIISEKHFDRLKGLIDDAQEKGGRVIFGGEYHKEQKYISPTLIDHVHMDMQIMEEEIFGPILPIIPFSKKEDVVSLIHSLPRPLSMYIFSNRTAHQDYYLKHTVVGGTVINDCLIHFANQALPFGGVGNSGLGRSHGQAGLYAFMNARGIMKQQLGGADLLHPPYTGMTAKVLKIINKII